MNWKECAKRVYVRVPVKMYYAAGRGGGSSKAGRQQQQQRVECRGGGGECDMDSVEKKK